MNLLYCKALSGINEKISKRYGSLFLEKCPNYGDGVITPMTVRHLNHMKYGTGNEKPWLNNQIIESN